MKVAFPKREKPQVNSRIRTVIYHHHFKPPASLHIGAGGLLLLLCLVMLQ